MKEKIIQFIKSDSILYPLFLKVYYRFSDRAMHSSSYWIHVLVGNEYLQLVQIGSNDGKSGDPLFHLIKKRSRWQCIFVEPVPYIFERLKTNYGDNDRFTFVNAAITSDDKLTFYWVDPKAKKELPSLPDWYDQLGSFKRENIVKHLDGQLEPYILSTDIKGCSLEGLLENYNINALHLLHIDTEGWDWNILSQLNLNKYQPEIILFEMIHLGELEIVEAMDRLKSKYEVMMLGGDFICILKNIKNRLTDHQLDFINKHRYEK